jgi:hypothetical protein
MKIVKNEKLLRRNGRIGQWTSLGALGVLGVGMYLSFQHPELFAYSIGALILGFAMTQVGMYFSNRWGRSPRPDEQLDTGLKGLPGEATLYHYVTPVPHLLVGPMGIWILLPFHQGGKVTYEKNRWRLKGGGFMQAYMTLFGQEGLGRPEIDVASLTDSLKRFLTKSLDEEAVPPINAALVFTSDKAEIDSPQAPMPALHIKKLKDFMRQKSKDGLSSANAISRVKECLPDA